MIFKPKWVKLFLASFPPQSHAYLCPSNKQIKELERVRYEHSIPHDVFVGRIITSSSTTRKNQKYCYDVAKIRNPEASEKKLLREVFTSRYGTAASELGGYLGLSEEDIDKAMENINSFDELCKYMIELDEEGQSFPDPLGVGKLIDEVLASDF